MKWENVVHEINELGFEITERDIRYEGNKMTIYNVIVKEKQFEDCYVLYLLSGTIEMLDDDSYISFRELDRINKMCNILTDYYENDIEKNKGDVAETREETKDKIKNIFFDSAEPCYGDLFVEISNEDFSYLTELYCDKPEEFKEWVPKIQWLSISDNDEYKYQCCDNRQDEAFQEGFKTIDKAIRWFEGESIDDIEGGYLEEDDEEQCQ